MRSSRRGRWIFVIGILTASFPLPGLAVQESPGSAPELTVEEAVELARVHNPDIRTADHGVRRAEAVQRRSLGDFLPELTADGSVGEASGRTQTTLDPFGRPDALDEPLSTSSVDAGVGMRANLTLFDGLQSLHGYRGSRSEEDAARQSWRDETQRVEAEVRRRFYQAMGAMRLVEVERELLRAAEERLAAAEAMVPAGRATRQDVLGAESDVIRQEMALEAAESRARSARLGLGEAVGHEEYGEVRPSGDFPELQDPEVRGEEEVVARAIEAHPRLEGARASADAASHQRRASRGTRWPTLQLSAQGRQSVQVGAFGQLGDFPFNRRFSLTLSASVPLFTGFSASEEIARGRAREGEASEEMRRARISVESEARRAFTEASAAYRTVRLADRNADRARERMELGQEGFQRGLIGFTELQQLIDRAAQAERRAVEARMEWAERLSTLDRAAGGGLVDELNGR